jgi:hypothetical protein
VSTDERADCYRKLFVQMGDARARELVDRLQVLALTQPETLREFEDFLGRSEDPQPVGSYLVQRPDRQ